LKRPTAEVPSQRERDQISMPVLASSLTRRGSDPTADSRGQVWRLDEQTMTATLVFNADLGN